MQRAAAKAMLDYVLKAASDKDKDKESKVTAGNLFRDLASRDGLQGAVINVPRYQLMGVHGKLNLL